MKSKLEIYALAVCFASVICLVVALGIAGYSSLELAAPQLTMRSHQYNGFQSNDAFWKRNSHAYKKGEKVERPSEAKLTKKRQEAFSIALKNEQRNGLQSLIQSFIFILVGSITLLIHWRIANKARE